MRLQEEKKYYWAQDVASKFGISKKTLFEWEKKGMLPRVPKDWRGWRMYTEEHLAQIKKVIEDKKRKIHKT